MSQVEVELYEIDRYYVTIDGGNRYLVDAQEFNGVGWCGCKDFQYKHLPELEQERESGLPHNITRRCKHIKALKEYIDK